MFNFMKKKADKAKTHNEIYLEVGTRLEQAKASNCLIIEMQARKLRDGNDRKLTAEERNRTYLSIKSAYYALFMIKIVRDRLFELQMNQELAKGMNEITEAMHLLDQLAANAQKPHLLRFQGLVRKMQKSSDGEVAMMKKMGETYTKTCSINQMVDNEVVKLIQEGSPLGVRDGKQRHPCRLQLRQRRL